MKRKRSQLLGDDGELLEAYPQKRKRGEGRSPRAGILVFPVLLIVAAIGYLVVGYYGALSDQDMNQYADALEAQDTAVSLYITPLKAVDRPTLPPAWTAFPTETPTDTPTITATATATSTPTATPQVRERVVTIEAQAGWQSGETLVEAGEVIEISYVEGRWVSWPGTGPYGPDGGFFGICDQDDCVEPLRGYSQAGMIGRIGEDGTMFPVGYHVSRVAERGGELQLRINDDYTTDNEGRITVRIVIKRYND